MDRILAAFIFFTRLPFWKIKEITKDNYNHVVAYWPLVGWFTGGISFCTLWITAHFVPPSVAIIITLLVRICITGGLHEDGLADFCDGFGGQVNRERTLAIMKDSMIGSYGVMGLIFYFLLSYTVLSTLPVELAALSLLIGDPYAKGVSSMIINRLPYARKAEEAKNKALYSPMTAKEVALAITCGGLPLFLLPHPLYLGALLLPILTWYGLTHWIKKRLQGYTGDCCGALTLLCELSFHLSIIILWTLF